MKNNNDKKILGQKGENLAASYLIGKGYSFLDKNHRSKSGEIDLIVEIDKTVVFVEVKTRTKDTFGKGFEAVDYRKREKIIRTAQLYMVKKPDRLARFDVISIDGGVINHIENAFTL